MYEIDNSSVSDFVDAHKLYELTDKAQMIQTSVVSESFTKFNQAIIKLSKALNNDLECESFFRDFMVPLWTYRRHHLLSLAPMSYFPDQEKTFDRLEAKMLEIQDEYPKLQDMSAAVIETLNECMTRNDNPMLEYLGNMVDEVVDEETVLLFAGRKYLDDSKEFIDSSMFGVSTPKRNLEKIAAGKIIIIGNPRLFNPQHHFIFHIPYAETIEILHLDCDQIHWIPQKSFDLTLDFDGKSSFSRWANRVRVKEDDISRSIANEFTQPELELLEHKWDPMEQFKNSVSVTETLTNENQLDTPTTDALFVKFSVGLGIFIPDDHTVHTIIDSEDGLEVKNLKPSDLEPNMFVLLRTGRGGDVIRDIADAKLGNEAVLLRSKQDIWKNVLRSKVRLNMEKSCNDLAKMGCDIANPQNIRNWVDSARIGPGLREDFDIIMKYISLSHKSREYWEPIVKLRKAHSAAGREVRHKLLTFIKSQHHLVEGDQIEFTLPGFMDQKMTAYKVESTDLETEEVWMNQCMTLGG